MRVEVILIPGVDNVVPNLGSEENSSDIIRISLLNYEGQVLEVSDLVIDKYKTKKTFHKLVMRDLGKTVYELLAFSNTYSHERMSVTDSIKSVLNKWNDYKSKHEITPELSAVEEIMSSIRRPE